MVDQTGTPPVVCVSVVTCLRGSRIARAGICAGKFLALRRRNAVYAEEGPRADRGRAWPVVDHQHHISLHTAVKAWLYLRPLKRDELVATLRTSLEDALMTDARVFHKRTPWEQNYLPTACLNKLGLVWYTQCCRMSFKVMKLIVDEGAQLWTSIHVIALDYS